MKRWYMVFLFVFGLVLAGCGEKKEDGDYQLYYVNYEKGIIESENFAPESEEQAAMIDEIVNRISDQEEGVGLLPADVMILNYEVSGDILRLNFNAAYRKMETVDEILFRASIVKNFVQTEGISYVQITIEGEELLDSKGNPVGMMGNNSFLENSGKDITAYQYTELELYFADKSGEKLVKEKRSVYYTSNSPIEKVVVEQLIRGPKEEGHYATLSANTGILSVSQADGIAYVNLDQRFVSEALTINQELPIYSIVNSLIAAGNVRHVQIAVNGDTKLIFRESMELNKLYEENRELVAEEQEDMEEESEEESEAENEETSTLSGGDSFGFDDFSSVLAGDFLDLEIPGRTGAGEMGEGKENRSGGRDRLSAGRKNISDTGYYISIFETNKSFNLFKKISHTKN